MHYYITETCPCVSARALADRTHRTARPTYISQRCHVTHAISLRCGVRFVFGRRRSATAVRPAWHRTAPLAQASRQLLCTQLHCRSGYSRASPIDDHGARFRRARAHSHPGPMMHSTPPARPDPATTAPAGCLHNCAVPRTALPSRLPAAAGHATAPTSASLPP